MVRAVVMGIDLFLDVPVTVAVGILSGYHIYCLTTNTTTIEGWERDETVTVKYKDKIKKVSLALYWNLYIYKISPSEPFVFFHNRSNILTIQES
jgi:hypothetical protein